MIGGTYKEEKVIRSELLAIQAVAADAQVTSSVLDVTPYSEATVYIDHARDIDTAPVGAGTEYRIEASEKASGNDTWRTAYSVVCGIAAASAIVTDGIEAAGQTQIETGATLPAVGDLVFFKHGTITSSEWAKVYSIDATGGAEHFHILDGLTSQQPQQTMYNKAEQFAIAMNLKSITRIRVVINNANGTTNRAIVSRVAIVTRG